MTGVSRVHWRETRGLRDPQFEPRDIISEGNPGNWRFYVQYLFEIRAIDEKPTVDSAPRPIAGGPNASPRLAKRRRSNSCEDSAGGVPAQFGSAGTMLRNVMGQRILIGGCYAV
jgi:hypothetical protein